MKKIKIARVVTVPFVFTHILDLLDSLSRDERFELHIVCSEGIYLDELKKRFPQVIIHILYIPREISLVADMKSLIFLTKLFLNEKFDIVHSFTPKAGLVTALAGFLSGSKIRLHSFTGQVWVHSTGLKRFLLKNIDKLIAYTNTHNYADSFGQKNFLLKNNIGNENSLSVIHKGSLGGINVERFDPIKLKNEISSLKQVLYPGFEGKILIYLGRQNRDKGLRELSKAFQSLKDKYQLKLLLVGPVETLEDANFSEVIKSLEKDDDVTFINFTSRPELYLGVSDIFCFPSYREGFGTVALEASAMEKPIVASNIYGLADAVSDHESGLLFEAKNIKDLESKIEKLLISPGLIEKLGKQGRERVIRDFTDKVLTTKVIEEYFRLLNML